MDTLFTAVDYKNFLRGTIALQPAGGRGVRKRLADQLGCQMGYISQVLSGPSHLSPEQAEAAARFFHLTPKETEYFLLLVAQNRAGTASLKIVYEGQLKQRRREARQLKSRLEIDGPRADYQQTYYGSWHYAAVHLALDVPELRSPASLSARLGISHRKLRAVLQFLVEHGLVQKVGGEFRAAITALHLDGKSPFIARHHANWRLQAIQAMEQDLTGLHYSGLVSASRKDLARIREKLSKCLEECIAIVRGSPPERLAALNMDLFSLASEE
jgi:uncharacterized protein (TIGR02147 family)